LSIYFYFAYLDVGVLRGISMEGNIKVGIIGAGEIARYHIQMLQEIRGVHICAICDVNLTRACEIAGTYGIESSYKSSIEMITESKPDVVHVLTPPKFHAQLSIEAMASGSHVLVEKPMALSFKDATKMVSTAKKTGKHLAICEMYLFDPVVLQARRLLEQGIIGRLLHVENYWFTDVSVDSNAYSIKGAGSGWAHSLPGGVFANFLDHPVYLQRELIGEIHCVNTVCKKFGDNPFLEYDELRVNLSGNNATGHIVSSLNGKPRVNLLRLYGTEGIITADMSNLTIVTLKSRRLPSFVTKGLNNLTQSYELARDTVKTTVAILRKKTKTRQGLRTFLNTFYEKLSHNTPDIDESSIFNCEKAAVTIKILDNIWNSTQTVGSHENNLGNKSYINHSCTVSEDQQHTPMQRKALVTGANGFLGQHLVDALLKKNYVVRVVLRKINKRFEQNQHIEVLYGDIREPEVAERAVEGVNIVYHCAALTTNKGPWHKFHDNNVEATRNLLDSAEKFGVEKFLFVSTVVVYGFKKARGVEIVSENDEHGNGLPFYSYYAKSKIEAEKLIWDYHAKKNLPVVVIRPGIIFGPNGKKAAPRKKLIFGAKEKVLPYIYVKDVVSAMILAGESDAAIGNAYNAVGDEQPTQGEFIRQKNRATQVTKGWVFIPRPIMLVPAYLFEFYYRRKKSDSSPPFSVYHYKSLVRNLRYDNKKLKSELGWSPSYSIEDGIKETFVPFNH
jgi:nucleoside-diphosphate-sugar epimerase/predicted dehydrogenase